jgi:hypothetical protein
MTGGNDVEKMIRGAAIFNSINSFLSASNWNLICCGFWMKMKATNILESVDSEILEIFIFFILIYTCRFLFFRSSILVWVMSRAMGVQHITGLRIFIIRVVVDLNGQQNVVSLCRDRLLSRNFLS